MKPEQSQPDLQILPANLPVPADDCACDHLPGIYLPAVTLLSTSGGWVDLSVAGPLSVIYFYPMTGKPGTDLPEGWDMIPGARGCTPQACGFRDHLVEISNLGASVLGVSSQTAAEQLEAKQRLQLPFYLLSDESLLFSKAMNLPTFEAGGRILIRRLTLIVREGQIVKNFYPVFPPDRHVFEVIEWLQQKKTSNLGRQHAAF